MDFCDVKWNKKCVVLSKEFNTSGFSILLKLNHYLFEDISMENHLVVIGLHEN